MNIKLSKADNKVYQSILYRYGTFNNCYDKMMNLLKIYDKKLPNGLIPSAYQIVLFSGDNKELFNNYKILGKYPKQRYNFDSKLHMFKNIYINEQKGNLNLNLNKIYKKDPRSLDFVKKKLKEYNTNDLSLMLFRLSLSIKHAECNKPEMESREIMNYYRRLFCK